MTDLRSTAKHSRQKLPLGTVRWRLRKGPGGVRRKVAMVKVSHVHGSGSWVTYSRYLYERHKGPIPPGMRVIHRNGDITDHDLDNLVLGTGGDVLWVHCHADPEVSAAQHARRAAAVARWNSRQAEVRRMTQILPTMWYPVDSVKRCVINTPTEQLWRLVGCDRAKNGAGVVGHRLGWPGLQSADACMLAVLVAAGDYLRWPVILERVRSLRASLLVEPTDVGSPSLAQSGTRLVRRGLAVRSARGVYAATPMAIDARGPVSPYLYVQGREIAERYAGYPLLSPEGAAAVETPAPQTESPTPPLGRGRKAGPVSDPHLSPAEIERLMRDHESMVWWIARRVMGRGASEEDLEDCASVVRLRFLRAARAYDPSRGVQFSTLAMRLAQIYAYRWKVHQRNRGVHVPDYLKGQGGVRVTSLDAPVGHGDERSQLDLVAAPGPEQPREIPASIWSVLGRLLTPKQLEMVKLRFVDGLEHSAIAGRFGCSRSNVQQQIAASLRKVKESAPALEQYLE